MGGIDFSAVLKKLPFRRLQGDSFVILDIGTFSVKALFVGGDGSVAASGMRYHTGNDINPDGSFNVKGVTNTCRATINELKVQSGVRVRFAKEVVLGIGGGFVFGKTLAQTYIRENPHEEIDERELANIVQKVEQRSYEQIRRDFKKETGRSELELHILNAAFQEIKIDGYQVVNPLGFKGKEITSAIFNAYIPKVYLSLFEALIQTLGLRLLTIVSGPYVVFRSFARKNAGIADFILIDIGGTVSEIALIRKGRLEDIRSISLGGSSFTRSISENLKIGFWEAENIKRRFAQGEVSGRVAKQIEGIVMKDTELFLHGLEMILSDMSQVSLLPARIYVYGGGSTVPLLSKLLKQKSWRDSLSFSSKPVVERLSTPELKGISRSLLSAEWITPLSMVDLTCAVKEEDELAKALKRSVRLLQT